MNHSLGLCHNHEAKHLDVAIRSPKHVAYVFDWYVLLSSVLMDRTDESVRSVLIVCVCVRERNANSL